MNRTPLRHAETIALSVIGDLASGQWEKVVARFDDQMKAELPIAALANAWAQIVGQAGAFERHGAPIASRSADLTVVDTPQIHEAGEYVNRIVVRDDERIAGFFILNPDAV